MISRWEIRGALIDLLNAHKIEVNDKAVVAAADRLGEAIDDNIDERLHQGAYADE